MMNVTWGKLLIGVGGFLVGALFSILYVNYAIEKQSDELFAEEVGPKVRTYLVENPEIIREVFQALQTKEQAQAAERRAAQLANNREELFFDPDSHVAGDKDAELTIVEFFDYNCGYCKRAHPDVMKLRDDTDGIRLVYKEFPILGEGSVLAAQAAMAAKRQDKYMVFHDALMAARGPVNEEKIMKVAAEVGLDTFQLAEDMEDPDIKRALDENLALARKLEITGTPTFVFGDEFVPGVIDLADMRALVEQEKKSCDIC